MALVVFLEQRQGALRLTARNAKFLKHELAQPET